jgi:drug/metabolite transporter (DMT)-like permease
MNKTSFRNPLLLLLTAVIWGVAFVAQSVGMDYVGPFTFNFVRCIIGGLVLIPCIFLLDKLRAKDGEGATERSRETGEISRDRDVSETSEIGKSGLRADGKARISEKTPQSAQNLYNWHQKELYIGGICCGLALFVASNLQQFGIQYTTVGKAGFITALYIVLVPLIGIFLKKESGLRIWISVLLAVCGLYLLCITDGFSISGGDLLVLLCALCFSVHILVIDYFSPRVDGVRMSCIQFFVCGLLSGVGMLLTEHFSIEAVWMAKIPILYAGVMSCGVAYTLQIVGQKGMNPTIASLILSLESVVSVLAGWLLLGQKLSPRELSGCVLMFAAIILAQVPRKQ